MKISILTFFIVLVKIACSQEIGECLIQVYYGTEETDQYKIELCSLDTTNWDDNKDSIQLEYISKNIFQIELPERFPIEFVFKSTIYDNLEGGIEGLTQGFLKDTWIKITIPENVESNDVGCYFFYAGNEEYLDFTGLKEATRIDFFTFKSKKGIKRFRRFISKLKNNKTNISRIDQIWNNEQKYWGRKKLKEKKKKLKTIGNVECYRNE